MSLGRWAGSRCQGQGLHKFGCTGSHTILLHKMWLDANQTFWCADSLVSGLVFSCHKWFKMHCARLQSGKDLLALEVVVDPDPKAEADWRDCIMTEYGAFVHFTLYSNAAEIRHPTELAFTKRSRRPWATVFFWRLLVLCALCSFVLAPLSASVARDFFWKRKVKTPTFPDKYY